MRIKSKRKDYYDYVAQMYGWGDPSHTYNRVDLGENIKLTKEGISRQLKLPNYGVSWSGNACQVVIGEKLGHIGIIYFCGRQYFVVLDTSHEVGSRLSGKIYDEAIHGELRNDWYLKGRHQSYNGIFGFSMAEPARGEFNAAALKLSREHKMPVFSVFSWLGNVYIDRRVPNLGDCGFGSIMTPEQCYQELANFVANSMHDSPDTSPPVVVEDKYKILAAGFDVKQSFRHRK